MSGMSKSVPDTRISKPRLRCFVCCLLGSINMRTYRQSSGCTTQGEWEVLDMGSAVIADEVEAAVKSPSSKWKQSLQRDKSSERHGNHCSRQHNSTITTFLEPLAVIKSQHGKIAVSQEPALKLKRERWRYKCVWMPKGVMDWHNSEMETQYVAPWKWFCILKIWHIVWVFKPL